MKFMKIFDCLTPLCLSNLQFYFFAFIPKSIDNIIDTNANAMQTVMASLGQEIINVINNINNKPKHAKFVDLCFNSSFEISSRHIFLFISILLV